MAFELPDLPYPHDALAAGGMSAETLEFHHDKHHKAYVDKLNEALAGEHCLVADVSDMRCVFDVTGEAPDQVLAKLSPTDLDGFPPDGLRRSRAAQVPVAFWRIPDGFRVIAFRSAEDYLRGILQGAAAPGTWLDPR